MDHPEEMTLTSEWQRGEYTISTEPARLDISLLHNYLSTTSYWAQGRTVEVVKRSIENSLCFGLYKIGAAHPEQVGFARVVTDYATFAWLADVFVLAESRGQGLAKWLLEVIVSHPELQGLRRWLLATKDAPELYRRFGFAELNDPARWMERLEPMNMSPLTGGEFQLLSLDRRNCLPSDGSILLCYQFPSGKVGVFLNSSEAPRLLGQARGNDGCKRMAQLRIGGRGLAWLADELFRGSKNRPLSGNIPMLSYFSCDVRSRVDWTTGSRSEI